MCSAFAFLTQGRSEQGSCAEGAASPGHPLGPTECSGCSGCGGKVALWRSAAVPTIGLNVSTSILHFDS